MMIVIIALVPYHSKTSVRTNFFNRGPQGSLEFAIGGRSVPLKSGIGGSWTPTQNFVPPKIDIGSNYILKILTNDRYVDDFQTLF
jgi:hypothetical protein